MGGVAVLHPQNILKIQFSSDNFINSHMKSRRNHNPKPNPNPNPDPNFTGSVRRKRIPPGIRRNNTTAAAVDDQPAKNLVMEQVKILKRGEPLNNTIVLKDKEFDQKNSKVELTEKEKNSKAEDDFVLSSTDWLGPDPEMVPKLAKFFAGSGFVESPPPSSLPLPAFFTKKLASTTVKEDPATDLRRMLGLNLP